MTLYPARDLAVHLESEVSRLTEGDNLFARPRTPIGHADIPAEAVFVFARGGLAAEPFNGEDTGFQRPTVIVRVRSDKDDFTGGEDLAIAVRNAIHQASVSGYIDWRLLQYAPNYLGELEAGFHEWSINAQPWYEE